MVTTIALCFGLFYVTWWMYIACMNIVRVWDRLPTFIKALLLPGVLIFIALDAFFINWIVLTIYFKELPRLGEWLATTRLKRMARGSNQKQSRKADIFCSYLLDYFDPTEDHC